MTTPSALTQPGALTQPASAFRMTVAGAVLRGLLRFIIVLGGAVALDASVPPHHVPWWEVLKDSVAACAVLEAYVNKAWAMADGPPAEQSNARANALPDVDPNRTTVLQTGTPPPAAPGDSESPPPPPKSPTPPPGSVATDALVYPAPAGSVDPPVTEEETP